MSSTNARRIVAAFVSAAFTAGIFGGLVLMNAGRLAVEPGPLRREARPVLIERRKPPAPAQKPPERTLPNPAGRRPPEAHEKRVTGRKPRRSRSPERRAPRTMGLPDILKNLNINPGIGLEDGPEIPLPDEFEFGEAGGPAELEKEEFKEGEVDAAPRLVRKKSPSYPRTARREEIEGYVTVEFLVDREGSVRDIHVVKSIPPGIFDEAVRSALRAYRFHPATLKGRPVNCRCAKTFRFVLWD